MHSVHLATELIKADQNAGRIHSVRIDNSTFERVEEFKYLGTALTNQNYIAEEIKSRLGSGNACYQGIHDTNMNSFEIGRTSMR